MSDRLRYVNRYAVYYGPGDPDLLRGYDLAVVAPEGWSPAVRRQLQSEGVRMIAYVSVLEVPAGPMPPAGVLRGAGLPLQNQEWGNWILDPRAPETLQRLQNMARELQAAGWDGAFLDTLSDLESPALPAEVRPAVVPAGARLVAAFRASWPGAVLIQNWGFGPLLPLTAPYLDGLCWEDFPYGELTPGSAASQLAGRLQAWSQQAGLYLFAINLGAVDRAAAESAARLRGFHWYGAGQSYVDPPEGSA